MAIYTETVYEILQKNATETEDITNIADMTAISNRTLFASAPLNVLSDTYRSNFVTMFTLHYFQDEIGFESLALWKMMLAEKLINNADRLNLLFQNLARQLYTEFAHTDSTAHGTRNSVGKTSGTENVTDNGKTGSESTVTQNSTTDQTGKQTATHNITNNTTTGYTDTVNETGTGSQAKTGTDTTTTDITTTRTDNTTATTTHDTNIQRTGGEISTETRNLTGKETGGYTDTTAGSEDTTGNDTTNNNAMGINFDTPQGSLENLRSPQADAKGKGISYVNDTTYNYMTAAQERDETNVVDRTGHNENESTTTRSYNDYAKTDTGTVSRDASKTDINEKTTGTDTTANTGTVSTVENGTQGTTYNSTVTDTRDFTTTDTNSGTSDSTDSGTRTVDDTTKQTINGTTTQTINGKSENTSDKTTTGISDITDTTQDNTDTDSYKINFLQLAMTPKLTDAIWEIFNDLFMQIFN